MMTKEEGQKVLVPRMVLEVTRNKKGMTKVLSEQVALDRWLS